MLLNLVQSLAAQQDYLWFCSLLVWLAAGTSLLVLRRRSGPAGTAWPALAALAGIGLAVTALLEPLFTPANPDQELAGRDLLFFALHFFQALVPGCILLRTQGRRAAVRAWVLVAGGVLLVSFARRLAFFPLDLAAHTVAVAAGLAVLRRPGARTPALTAAMVLGNLAFLFSPVGAYSEILHQQLRFSELPLLGLPAAVLQTGLGLVWLGILLPEALDLLAPGYELRRGWRMAGLASALAVWLGTGFGIASWTGSVARAGFENSLLARVQVCTALLRADGAEAVMTSAFRIEHLGATEQPGGRMSRIARSGALIAAARPVRHDLDRIQAVNPDIYWAHFLTLRDGYLVTAALAERMPANKDVVPVHRLANARDYADWAEHRSYVEGPVLTDYGEVLRACAPIVSPRGRMLGWLSFETGAAQWANTQFVARFQTFAVLGIGASVGLLLVLLRARGAAHESAQRAARAAAAADQAKTIFLAKVSHELRTPVQSILGYGELLQDHPGAAEQGQWLQAINGQGRLLIRLVNDLIDLSALQSGAFCLTQKPGRLPELIRQTAESLRPLADSKGLTLRVEISERIPAWLMVDEARVRQVVLNLIGNAIKFTSQGSVHVRLEPAADADAPEHAAFILSIRDTGPGISAEHQAGLFRPFNRLDQTSEVEGAGLGLALSRALCEEMAGTLSVQSDGRTGSVFTARWVFAACEAPDQAPAAARATLAGRRVLVADDNALVAEFFLAVLRSAGAWCDHAVSGLEAVALAGRTRYDVVVLDLAMPGLGGFEAARQIRATGNPVTRLIGVSAHVQPEDRLRAESAGMEALLVKPISSRELLAVVAQDGAPPAVSPEDLALIRRLRAQFERELPGLHSAITLALADGNLARCRERVHYLKNSADIVHLAELSALCARVESAATPEDAAFGPAARELLACLNQLLVETPSTHFRPPAGS